MFPAVSVGENFVLFGDDPRTDVTTDFQELEKLISFSGTPTVVWRRTGEICLVAPEFCMLTEWPMEELVSKKKYIYEASRFF